MSEYHPRTTDAGMAASPNVYKYIYGTTYPTIPLPNCTFYAFSRTMELALERGYPWSDVQHYSNPFWWRNESTYPNATSWWTQAGNAGIWQRSETTPQLGAIACFYQRNNDGGHVAVVEGINGDGTVNLSFSEYGGRYFVYVENATLVRGQRMKVNGNIYGFGSFQGYLINPLTAGDIPGPPIGGKKLIPFRRGQWVKIIQCGNANSYGTGGKAYGIGWNRQIKQIYTGRPFPYQVGYVSGGTTGFYKADALRKI